MCCRRSQHQWILSSRVYTSDRTRIEFGGKDSEFTTQYAAFYADCQHEITPVTVGYRVCLVYNLAIADKKQPTAPGHSTAVEEAAQLLEEVFADQSLELSKIAIPLTHQYTEAGLDLRRIVAHDQATSE